MRIVKMIVLCVSVLFSAAACQQQQKSLVRAPFSEVSLPEVSISFDVSEGDTLLLDNGTSIVVPPQAFVGPAGEKITGEVKLVYREMRNVQDILISGIPMNTEIGDKQTVLESAVMWELRAFQDTVELELDSLNSKKITTKIASNIADPDYDIYFLDEDRRAWNLLGSVVPRENERFTDALINILKAERDAESYDLSNCFALNYVDFIDARDKKLNNNFHYFHPRTAPQSGTLARLMQEKLKSYGANWLNGRPFNTIVDYLDKPFPASLMLWESSNEKLPLWMNSIDEKIILNISENHTDNGRGSTDVRHTATHRLTFWKWEYDATAGRSHKKILHTMYATPRFPLNYLFEKKPEGWTAEYEQLLSKAEEERRIYEAQGRVMRTFEMERMGIFNYDKPLGLEQLVVDASFKIRGQEDEELFTDIFVVPEGNNTVVRYSPKQLEKFALYPSTSVIVFSVTKGNQIVMLDQHRLKMMDYNKLQLYNGKPKLHFYLEPTQYVVEDMDDVTRFLTEQAQNIMASRN